MDRNMLHPLKDHRNPYNRMFKIVIVLFWIFLISYCVYEHLSLKHQHDLDIEEIHQSYIEAHKNVDLIKDGRADIHKLLKDKTIAGIICAGQSWKTHTRDD